MATESPEKKAKYLRDPKIKFDKKKIFYISANFKCTKKFRKGFHNPLYSDGTF